MSLKELQKQFLSYIYKNEELTSAAEDIISPSLRDSMAIYRRHVWYSLIATLESHYISVRHILGKERFLQLAEQYIGKNPSQSPDLECYGFSFPQFLKDQEVAAYLQDLAKLDLAYVKSAIAKEYKATPLEEFQNIPPANFENLVFTTNPSNIICELSYNVFDIFTEIKSDSYKDAVPLKERTFIIISRDSNHNISHQKIQPSDVLFLSLCNQGKQFYDIYSALENSYKDFDCQNSLTKLIQNQYIIAFTIN